MAPYVEYAWYLHDGAPAHCAQPVHDWLQELFPNCEMGYET